MQTLNSSFHVQVSSALLTLVVCSWVIARQPGWVSSIVGLTISATRPTGEIRQANKFWRNGGRAWRGFSGSVVEIPAAAVLAFQQGIGFGDVVVSLLEKIHGGLEAQTDQQAEQRQSSVK